MSLLLLPRLYCYKAQVSIRSTSAKTQGFGHGMRMAESVVVVMKLRNRSGAKG